MREESFLDHEISVPQQPEYPPNFSFLCLDVAFRAGSCQVIEIFSLMRENLAEELYALVGQYWELVSDWRSVSGG
jgi:hypothetical protein